MVSSCPCSLAPRKPSSQQLCIWCNVVTAPDVPACVPSELPLQAESFPLQCSVLCSSLSRGMLGLRLRLAMHWLSQPAHHQLNIHVVGDFLFCFGRVVLRGVRCCISMMTGDVECLVLTSCLCLEKRFNKSLVHFSYGFCIYTYMYFSSSLYILDSIPFSDI